MSVKDDMTQLILTSSKAFGIIKGGNTFDDFIDLSIGEPKLSSFPIEFYSQLAKINSLSGYYPAEGDLELRKLLINKYFPHSQNLNLFITHGAIGAIDVSLRSLLSTDDEVLIPNPGFPPYEKLIQINNLKSKRYDINLHEKENTINFESIINNISEKTRLIIINSPHNPTGKVLSQNDKLNLLKLIDQNPRIYFLFDEVYKDFDYSEFDNEFEISLHQKENCLFVNSFSKAYPLAGSRIGWLAFDKSISNSILPVIQNTFGSISSQGQELAKMFLQSHINYYQQYLNAKNFAVKVASELGLDFIAPDGAVYLFIDTKSNNDFEFVTKLKEMGIISSPGSAFGSNGKGFIRISYAAKEDQVKTALIKVAQLINNIC